MKHIYCILSYIFLISFLIQPVRWELKSDLLKVTFLPSAGMPKLGLQFHCRLPSKYMQMCSAFRVAYKEKRPSQSPFFSYLTTDHSIFLSCFCAIFSMLGELTVSPQGRSSHLTSLYMIARKTNDSRVTGCFDKFREIQGSEP